MKSEVKIEAGEIGSDQLSKMMTEEIAKELVALAQDIESGKIADEDLAKFLAMILRKLSRGKVKSLKKSKKKRRTAFDIIAEQILKTFAKNKVNRKQNVAQARQPGYLANALINDLDNAIIRLASDSRLDSDANDIQLIEDVIAVNQKVATLTSRVSASTKGMSMRLISAMSVTAGVGGMKGLATLSTLKGEAAMESWSQANQIDFEEATGRVDAVSEKEMELAQESIKNKLIQKSANAELAGPNDVPTTDAVKELKAKKSLEWQQSLGIDHS